MIISNSKQFIFIHLHKCAGTNISRTLAPISEWNDIECGGTKLGESHQKYYKERFGIDKHSKAFEIRGVVGDDLWDKYFTFAFVRNPFSRAVSLYTFIGKIVDSRGIKKYTRMFGAERRQKFWSWPLTQAYIASNSFSDFIRHENFATAVGSQPQFLSVSDKGQKQLIIDYVGKVENLEEDFTRILEHIGLNKLILERKKSSSKKQDYHDYYRTKEDYSLIYDMFKVDFESFGYDALEIS